MLADTRPDTRTVALRLIANIGDHAVEISHEEMQEAAAPRCFNPREAVDVDLAKLADQSSHAYWSVAPQPTMARATRGSCA